MSENKDLKCVFKGEAFEAEIVKGRLESEATHQVEHALRYADRLLVFLKNGNVYSGKKEELLNKGVLSWAEIS